MSNWVLKSSDPNLLSDIKLYEGTISYQSKLGYYKDNKFWTYKDSLGYPTIGYGHLLTEGENFKTGLTESQANELLAKDLASKVADAKSLYEQYNMTGGIELQKVLTQMVFQMGKGKVSQFKNTLSCMGRGDYKGAAAGMRNSAWYKQTTSRAEKLAKIVESL
ncbi:Phage baseplate hub subunit (T4-like gp5) / Phage tail lysozyme (T4-like gp5) [Yersinia phage fHe-Yen9-04]|uniref:Lysozyme n=2 Tax=Eneladusvirus Yen904 TaxID=2560849 RepID=A0A2C9CX75_9CAUD|nr:baseplate hub subunit and tail lysozyme [Yersinia phage fHe-Yen9-04]SOK58509.1 Phage baseplate hub subunit (T4-like gp5) / Phage tail lysozyme (T4-like gp5) [Yersinia phage fHe-Yen9-04]SOK59044.1 Phage baseplate hub subunit (T4-like gp5) / Phage tail lysozyme (T4-like gp5) [Yersinia phage fHe-Yen9-03]VUE36278.1 Phage baseplate hub subunit (T4-like gp5) / Phage tail lysozyme (T4-like gp5) [Yersinia phage fHe-Yen9-04]